MKKTLYLKHFGVYGVALKGNQLYCIKKNAGPYTARYDLPGGSQEDGEGLTETLHREILEETGRSVKSFSNNRIYDSFVKDDERDAMVHHLFALYDVELSDTYEDIPSEVADGKNDSNGAYWVDLHRLHEFNASPLILKVIDEIEQKQNVLEKSLFETWKVYKNN